MNTLLRIIKRFWLAVLLLLCLHNNGHAQGFSWESLATNVIESSSRSAVQEKFKQLENVNFSTAARDSYISSAKALGLGSKPSTSIAISKISLGLKPLSVSPFPLYKDLNLAALGNGRIDSLFRDKMSEKQKQMRRTQLSDYLTENALAYVNNLDMDGIFSEKLLKSIEANNNLAALLNAQPSYADILKKESGIADIGGLPFLRYLKADMAEHQTLFKDGAIPTFETWDYSVNNGSLLISGQKGLVATISSDNIVEIGSDIAMLNCELPPSSSISFLGNTYKTDRLGRIIEITIPVIKNKYKDKNKRQLGSKNIIAVKGSTTDKPLLLIPKDFGGVETWCNVVPMTNSKLNNDAIKSLNKAIKELLKTPGSTLSINLIYDSSTSRISTIQYRSSADWICTIHE